MLIVVVWIFTQKLIEYTQITSTTRSDTTLLYSQFFFLLHFPHNSPFATLTFFRRVADWKSLDFHKNQFFFQVNVYFKLVWLWVIAFQRKKKNITTLCWKRKKIHNLWFIFCVTYFGSILPTTRRLTPNKNDVQWKKCFFS